MKKSSAEKIYELMRSNTDNYFFQELNFDEPYHQWVDNKPIIGGFEVRRQEREIYHFVLLVWNDYDYPEEYYLVIFSGNRTVAEIHNEIQIHKRVHLHWTYSPSKRDGQNVERKEYFSKYYGDTNVYLSIPIDKNELEDFLEAVFNVCNIRIKSDELDNDEPELYYGFPEGKVVEKLHKRRERSWKVIKMAKQKALDEHGNITCQICGFNPIEKYGKYGEGIIEGHHTIPLSELKEDTITKVEDIVLLCPTCHRVVHRKRPWLSIEELKETINNIC